MSDLKHIYSWTQKIAPHQGPGYSLIIENRRGFVEIQRGECDWWTLTYPKFRANGHSYDVQRVAFRTGDLLYNALGDILAGKPPLRIVEVYDRERALRAVEGMILR